MRTHFVTYCILAIVALSTTACPQKPEEKKEAPKTIIIAYVGGFRGETDVDKVSANKITHINYAFVNVVDGKAVLTNEATDTINFRKLNLLKEKNPDLKILISLGGWGWSKNFSDAVLTAEGREAFSQSALDIMTTYKLDGIDIDWEYPAIPGDDGNIYRPEDKQTYTLMFASLRAKLDSVTKITNEPYLLTTATGGFSKFLENTEMGKAQEYLDYVNIMTYDAQSSEIAIHHTNLYASDSYEPKRSADLIVQEYIKAGVPANKLVMGIAFYGRTFKLKDDATKGLGDKVEKQVSGKGFTYIKDSLENRNGYAKSWDSIAHAPYLFNSGEKLFVTYDDEQSVKAKCEYVLQNGMAGVMFWEYSSDPKEYLLDAINEALK
ncbi:glycoside hydrolase family 18 protein [Dysgonomonas sp. ZJ709]|uniref:glycoside hydrolase family 18 protein n=1 Tax=Dysgonomonas sp. ZJ709 TaxID=2709797 RepID=UPI0013EDD587|nr:glycoside hydrolase family 18 protein [Dysgonomonas sp. ZJ709]